MAGGAARRLTSGKGSELRAVPVLVARRPHDRLRRLDRRRAGADRTVGARGGKRARRHQPAGPLRPPAFLARRPHHRLRARQRRRADLADLVRQSRRLSRRGERRRAGARRQGCREPALRRRQRPPVHDRRERRQAPAGQHRPQRRGAARPCHRRTGQRFRRLARRPARRLPPELPGVRDAADARRAGGRSRRPRTRRCPSRGSAMRGADYIHWSQDGAQLHWSLGPDALHRRRRPPVPAAPAPRGRAQVRARRRAACRWRWSVAAAKPTRHRRADRRAAGDDGRGRRRHDR